MAGHFALTRRTLEDGADWCCWRQTCASRPCTSLILYTYLSCRHSSLVTCTKPTTTPLRTHARAPPPSMIHRSSPISPILMHRWDLNILTIAPAREAGRPQPAGPGKPNHTRRAPLDHPFRIPPALHPYPSPRNRDQACPLTGRTHKRRSLQQPSPCRSRRPASKRPLGLF